MSNLKAFLEKEKQLLQSATPGPWIFQWTGDEKQTEDPEWIVNLIEKRRASIDGEGLEIKLLLFREDEGPPLVAEPGDFVVLGRDGYAWCSKDYPNDFIANVRESHAKALEIIEVMREALDGYANARVSLGQSYPPLFGAIFSANTPDFQFAAKQALARADELVNESKEILK